MWTGQSILDQVRNIFGNTGSSQGSNPQDRGAGATPPRGVNPNRGVTATPGSGTTATTATQPSGSAQGYQRVQNVSTIPESEKARPESASRSMGLPIPIDPRYSWDLIQAAKLIGSGGYDFSTGTQSGGKTATGSADDGKTIPDAGIPSIPGGGVPGHTTTVGRNVPPPPEMKATAPTFDRYEQPEWKSGDPANVKPMTDPPKAYQRDKEKYAKLIGK